MSDDSTRHAPQAEHVMRKWQCFYCGFIYDQAVGMPDDGIVPGTAWDDIPDDFTCPDCGAAKSEFLMLEIGE